MKKRTPSPHRFGQLDCSDRTVDLIDRTVTAIGWLLLMCALALLLCNLACCSYLTPATVDIDGGKAAATEHHTRSAGSVTTTETVKITPPPSKGRP